MMTDGPFANGKVHVLSEKCKTCIFRPGNPMSLQPGRVKGMVDSAKANDSAITCHSTLYDEEQQQAVCRGFYDAYGPDLMWYRMAHMFNIVTFIEEPAKS